MRPAERQRGSVGQRGGVRRVALPCSCRCEHYSCSHPAPPTAPCSSWTPKCYQMAGAVARHDSHGAQGPGATTPLPGENSRFLAASAARQVT